MVRYCLHAFPPALARPLAISRWIRPSRLLPPACLLRHYLFHTVTGTVAACLGRFRWLPPWLFQRGGVLGGRVADGRPSLPCGPVVGQMLAFSSPCKTLPN